MADINMIRGDDVYVYLTPSIDGVAVALEEGDVLRFKVFDDAGLPFVEKDATAADQDVESLEVVVKIDAEDTQDLTLSEPKEFKWEAELYTAESGDYCTPFYNRSLLIRPDRITPEVREGD